MKNIDLTIIVPMYNSEKNIEKCITSLLKIDSLSIEIIVVDDGSIDNGWKICEKLKKENDNMILLKQENKGPSAARNLALKSANGNFIMFVDSDDWINYEEFNALINDIDINKYDTIMYDALKIDEKGNEFKIKRFRTEFEYGNKINLYNNLVTSYNLNCIWNNVYSSSLIKCNNIYFREDMKNGEDFVFNKEYFEVSKKGIYIKKIIYNYSFNSEGITQTFFIRKFDDLEKTYNLRNEIIKKYLDNENIIISQVNNMYSKVLFRYISNAKKIEISNEEIYKKIKETNLNDIVKYNKKDKILYKFLKLCIRKRWYRFIHIIKK